MDMRRGLCCKQWSLEDMTCLFVCLRVVTCGWELELELELGVSK